MSRKFWFAFVAFYIYVFPLFFSYTAIWPTSPIIATITLGIGIVLWIVFIHLIYLQFIALPKKQQEQIQRLKKQGYLTKGTVNRSVTIKEKKHGTRELVVTVEFINFAGSKVNYDFSFLDTKPNEKRYDVGNTLYLKLSLDKNSPGLIIDGMDGKVNTSFGIFLLIFSVAYMIISFIIHYSIYSNGNGWRFLSFWHPWLMSPLVGIFSTYGFTKLLGKIGSVKGEEKLILHGKKTRAKELQSNQTGVYINEQPQIKYLLEFSDVRGKQHTITIKKIVLLTELHHINTDYQEILYLPEDPKEVILAN